MIPTPEPCAQAFLLVSAHTGLPCCIKMKQQEAGSEQLLKDTIEQRAERLALYIVENRTTVRDAAKKFHVSKSTVHKDIVDRLEKQNYALYLQAKEILNINKQERHIRGGMATREKYEKLREH